jgi:hypothetical protein
MIHIDCFSALDDLPKKKHGDAQAVINMLAKTKSLSSFELQDSAKLARTVASLEKQGRIKIFDAGYPWYRVEVVA